MFIKPSTPQAKMSSMEFGREVPTLRWEDLEEDLQIGPILNDIFLGAPRSPLQTLSVAFVEGERDMQNDGYYHKFNSNHAQQQQHFVTPPNGQIHPSSNVYDNNEWFDDYVSFNKETFGASSKSLPINTGSNFPTHSINSFNPNTDYDSNLFYSNSFSGFHQPASDHQMHDLSGPSTSGNNITTTTQFAQLNIQEPSFGIDSNVPPPIPESEYSASYSAPGSAYSTDWSSGSEHSSAQSQDEILDEIVRECTEIERKSVSPPIRHKVHAKRRSNTVVKHPSNDNEQLASNSSNNSLSGAGNSDRKKELNRIAATKYREKKRLEREVLGSEHKHLETRNHELRATVKELRTEVNYLKKLMNDMKSRANQN